MPETIDVTSGTPVPIPSESNVNEDIYAGTRSPNWMLYGIIALALYFLLADGGTFSFESEEE